MLRARRALRFSIACSFNRAIGGFHFVKIINGFASGCTAIALALGLAMGAASVAEAAIITVTVTGIVDNSAPTIDTGDFFSANQADLSGAAFSAQFVFNDATPGALNIEFGQSGSPIETLLGQNNGAPSVLQSLSVSIDGFTDNIDPIGGSVSSSKAIFSVSAGGTYGPNFYSIINLDDFDSSAPFAIDYHTNATYELPAATTVIGFLLPPVLDFYNIVPGTISLAEGVPLTVQEITVSSVGTPARFSPPSVLGVPEPSTWGMMILGVAMIGLARRRAKAIAVAA